MNDPIHIKKSHDGEFTAKARAAGYSSDEAYARYVLGHKDIFHPDTIKQANFCLEASRWKKK